MTVTSYEIRSEKIPEGFDGCKILVLADLHNACFGTGNERLLERIRNEKPDYILLAGDMLVGKRGQPMEVPIDLITRLGNEYPVYYGRGNHELRLAAYPEDYGDMWKVYRERLGASVHWLINQSVELERNGDHIRLSGLDLSPIYYKRFHKTPLSKETMIGWLGKPDPNGYQIVIAHNPEYFPEYADWGADLVLSGHLHGGMIRLPGLGGVVSPMVRLFPKYDRGRYRIGDCCMLLSGGLGNHTFKFRVNNIPEILSVTLTCQRKSCRRKEE